MPRTARTHTTATVASALRDLADVLDAMTPAPATKPKAAPKPKAVAAKVVPTAPAKKGASALGEISRKDWNRTLTTKARLAGKRAGQADESVYSALLTDWVAIQARRAAGETPDAVLADYLAR